MTKKQPVPAGAPTTLATQLAQRKREQDAEFQLNSELTAKFAQAAALFEKLREIKAADLDYGARQRQASPFWIELLDLECEFTELDGNGDVVRDRVEQDLRERLDHYPGTCFGRFLVPRSPDIDGPALLDELTRLLDRRDDPRNPPALCRDAQHEFDEKTGIGDGPPWRAVRDGADTSLTLAPRGEGTEPRQPIHDDTAPPMGTATVVPVSRHSTPGTVTADGTQRLNTKVLVERADTLERLLEEDDLDPLERAPNGKPSPVKQAVKKQLLKKDGAWVDGWGDSQFKNAWQEVISRAQAKLRS